MTNNYKRIFRYMEIKKIPIKDITDLVVSDFENQLTKDNAQIIRKTSDISGMFDYFQKKGGYSNTQYMIILNKSITYIPFNCTISDLYKVLDNLYNGYTNDFKHLCTLCSNELTITASKCAKCETLFCDDCYDKLTDKKHIFSCSYCKQTIDTENQDTYMVQIKNNLIIKY